MKQVFSRDELATAFGTFEQTVAHAAETKNWDEWVQHYTPDVDYIEHAAGTMKGRDEVRTWIRKTMTTFPGSHMTEFPSLWSVIDEATGRIICELDNPMRDPGDGTIISCDKHLDRHLCRRRQMVSPGRRLQPTAVLAGRNQVVQKSGNAWHA